VSVSVSEASARGSAPSTAWRVAVEAPTGEKGTLFGKRRVGQGVLRLVQAPGGGSRPALRVGLSYTWLGRERQLASVSGATTCGACCSRPHADLPHPDVPREHPLRQLSSRELHGLGHREGLVLLDGRRAQGRGARGLVAFDAAKTTQPGRGSDFSFHLQLAPASASDRRRGRWRGRQRNVPARAAQGAVPPPVPGPLSGRHAVDPHQVG